ncbi:MAG: F0F1 ATP synthase subunit B' [Geminicoccaceae bacterium]|nr:F0F1 ATP synthase subunit B' [Geminicoccaceae bacterium]
MRRFGSAAFGWCVATLPLAALAATEAADEMVEVDAQHAEGMPQLDPDTFASQIFWLVVFFALLYWLVSRKILPAIEQILETRRRRIADDLDRAAALRAEAEEAYTRYESGLADAHAAAQARLAEVRERVQTEQAERQAKLDADLAARAKEAQQRIRAAREQALAGIDSVAVEAARAATSRLIGVDVGEDEARRAMQAVRGEAA